MTTDQTVTRYEFEVGDNVAKIAVALIDAAPDFLDRFLNFLETSQMADLQASIESLKAAVAKNVADAATFQGDVNTKFADLKAKGFANDAQVAELADLQAQLAASKLTLPADDDAAPAFDADGAPIDPNAPLA